MTVLAPPATAGTRAIPARSMLLAVRPLQWVKNLLVLAAPVAAGNVLQPRVAVHCLGAIAALVCTSSAGYLVNDVRDRHLDRDHPRKRLRPIASGALPVRTAVAAAAILTVLGLGLAAVTGPLVLLCVGAYTTITGLYVFRLKHVAGWEVAAVASGFVLRTVAGAAAAHVPPSGWLVVAVSSAAVHIVVSKRSSELVKVGAQSRPVLSQYTAGGLRQARLVTAILLSVSYLGWALTRDDSPPARVAAVLTAVPVMVVVARWFRLTEGGQSEAPERVLVRDRVIGLGVLTWAALFIGTLWLR